MIADGEIDALCTASVIAFARRPSHVRRLFEDYVAVERDYFQGTRIFPIMPRTGSEGERCDQPA